MTLIGDFLGILQTGQDMSLESQFGATLIFTFPAQGNPGGYACSTGPEAKQMAFDAEGVMLETLDKAFRIRRELLANDGIVLVEQKTLVTASGVTYRLDRLVDRASDPCLYLACKQT
jgi:hypothetical protein